MLPARAACSREISDRDRGRAVGYRCGPRAADQADSPVGARGRRDPDRYPTRNEVADYLRDSAADLDCPIYTRQRVTSVTYESGGYRVRTGEGGEFTSRAVVAATGSFAHPHWPDLPGLESYTGTLLHAADYRGPERFTKSTGRGGQRREFGGTDGRGAGRTRAG